MEVMRPARGQPWGRRVDAIVDRGLVALCSPADVEGMRARSPHMVFLTDDFHPLGYFTRLDRSWLASEAVAEEVRRQLAAQATGATTDPAVVHDATAEVIPFWVGTGRVD